MSLLETKQTNNHIHSHITWNKIVPLKVLLFASRIFTRRTPTKDNLIHRGVVPCDSLLCVGRCGKDETINHLFIGCDYIGSV